MSNSGPTARSRPWPAFLAWFLTGAAFLLGLLSIMTIGPPILLAAAAATVALGVTRRSRRGTPGLVSGLAVPLFYVAFLNRSGPGEVCTTTGDVTECIDQWSPLGWAAAGLISLVAGVFLFRQQQE